MVTIKNLGLIGKMRKWFWKIDLDDAICVKCQPSNFSWYKIQQKVTQTRSKSITNGLKSIKLLLNNYLSQSKVLQMMTKNFIFWVCINRIYEVFLIDTTIYITALFITNQTRVDKSNIILVWTESFCTYCNLLAIFDCILLQVMRIKFSRTVNYKSMWFESMFIQWSCS